MTNWLNIGKKSAFDREIEEFEMRLLSVENLPAGSKPKPNLGEGWLKNLKQTLQRKFNAA